MQHYAAASTLYNFGYASKSMEAGSIPIMDFAVVQNMKNQLATNITNFRIQVVGMPGSATRSALLGLVDAARKLIVEAQSFLDTGTKNGLWTKQLENSTLTRINAARDKYNAAAGMAATTAGPIAPGVQLTTPGKPPPVVGPVVGPPGAPGYRAPPPRGGGRTPRALAGGARAPRLVWMLTR